MTREPGQYRKMLLEQQEHPRYHFFAGGGETTGFPWYRIRFYVSLVLFLCYVLLDYTGVSFFDLDSQKIVSQVQRDMTKELHVDTLLAQMMRQVEVTEGDVPPAKEDAPEEEAGETKEEAGETKEQASAEEGMTEDGEDASAPTEGEEEAVSQDESRIKEISLPVEDTFGREDPAPEII